MRLLPLLLLMLLGPAQAQQSSEPPCVIVYSHGRNLGEAAENAAWDRVNARFNEQLTRRLQASGRRAQPLLLKIGTLDLALAVQRLLGEAQRLGCNQVVDATLFADEDSDRLVVRLRVHPLLPSLGPRAGPALPRIGDPSFTSQRDFDLHRRSVEQLDLAALAAELLQGWRPE